MSSHRAADIRTQILAETVARLEAERFSPPHRYEYAPVNTPPRAVALFPVSREEALSNATRLLAAVSGDRTVIDLREKRSA